MKKVHIIFCHPKKSSLNHSLFESAKKLLDSKKCIVNTTDIYTLYRENHPAVLPYGESLNKKQIQSIQHEQEKIRNAELTLLQFPLYWFGFPGLLKNYWDQLLTPGFAYPGKFSESPLADGRRVLFSLTTQSNEDDFSEAGLNGSMQKILYPLTVLFRFVGYEIATPFIIYGVHNKSEQEIAKDIANFESHLCLQ